MDVVVTFLITVIGGVVCRIICRWSDGDGDDNWILKNPGSPPPGVFRAVVLHVDVSFCFLRIL